MTISYREVTMDTVIAQVIDTIVSHLPKLGDEVSTIILNVKGREVKHDQSTSDAMWCNLLSTMFNNNRPHSGNEIDRIMKINSPYHASVARPVLVKKKVIELTDDGYVFTQLVHNFIESTKLELEGKAKMINTPSARIEPWLSLTEGVHPDARMTLVTKSRGTQVSDQARIAVNLLQAVKFTVSPTINNVCREYIGRLSTQLLTATTAAERDKIGAIIDKCVELERLYTMQPEFSFAITCDWRTRMYYRSNIVQPQGSDLEKAAFQFANYMPMSEEALFGMRVHVANTLGRDKISVTDRISFMQQEGWRIAQAIANNPTIETASKYMKEDKCFQALVACVEYVRVIKLRLAQGNWAGIESNLVCHADGTCNGIQHSAALLEDRATATSVNCTQAKFDDVPSDIYGLVAETATELAASNAGLAFNFTRDICKKPVMVTGYGASEDTVRAAISNKLGDLRADVITKLQDAVLNAIKVHAAAVVRMTEQMNEAVQKWFKDHNKEEITWRTQDGCIIKQKYMDDANKVVIPSGFSFKLTKLKDEVQVDVEKMARALSPNFVHSQDATHLRNVIRGGAAWNIVAVHDSIGCHPATWMSTNQLIRREFVKLHQSNPLRTLEKWNGPLDLNKTHDYNVNEAFDAINMFN